MVKKSIILFLGVLVGLGTLSACGPMEINEDSRGLASEGQPSSALPGASDDLGPQIEFKAEDFFDTGGNNSLVQNDSLFDVTTIDGKRALYTKSTQTNIHTHFLKDFPLNSFVYSGKMRVSDVRAGIGVTFLSQYPEVDAYYRFRRYEGEPQFHIANHGGSSVCEGTSVKQDLKAHTWYNFKVSVQTTNAKTAFSLLFWKQGDLESSAQKIECEDTSSKRLTAGTIGMWAMGPGEKYWGDLKLDIDLIGAPIVDNEDSNEPQDPIMNEDKEDEVVVVEEPVVSPPMNNPPMDSSPLAPGDFPNAENTGSRIARANLTPSSISKISSPGLYQGLLLSGKITIDADNVTLRDCVVRGPIYINGANARLEYVEIDGQTNGTGFNTGIGLATEFAKSAPYVFRNYIHHFFDLTRPGGVGIEIQESYLYDWGAPTDGNHADAMQFPVWSQKLIAPNKIILNRNTVYEPSNGDYTAAMGFNSLTSEWIVTNNYFRGSGFMLYISEGGYTLSGNIFAGDFKWGTHRFFNDGANYGVWEKNTNGSGKIIPPPK